MAIFSIIVGVITLIGVFLQIQGMFPEYKRYYVPATIFFAGLTVGFILNSLSGTSIHFPDTISLKNILGFVLFGSTGLLILMSFTVAIFAKNNKQRTEISNIGCLVSVLLIVLLFLFSSTFFPKLEKNYLTFDESMELISIAIENKNYARALQFLEDQKQYLDIADPRVKTLEKLSSDIQSFQITIPIIDTPKIVDQKTLNSSDLEDENN